MKEQKKDLTEERGNFRENKLATLTGAGMKLLIFILIVIALVLIIIYLAVQVLVFLLPLLLIVIVVWLIFRYFNGLKRGNAVKLKIK